MAGAIYSFENELSFDSCVFDSNSAYYMSGDIAAFGGTFELYNSDFINSRVLNGSGGSIWVGSSYSNITYIIGL